MKIDLTSLLNLSRLNPTIAVADSVLPNKESLLKLNDAQLDQGEGSDGHDLGSYKNFKYKGRFRPIDLKKQGDFRNSEDIIADNEEMVFVDPDFKTGFLTSRFGQVLGLTDKSMEAAGQILLPTVIEKIEGQLS